MRRKLKEFAIRLDAPLTCVEQKTRGGAGVDDGGTAESEWHVTSDVVERGKRAEAAPPFSIREWIDGAPWLADYAFVIRSTADAEALLDAAIAARTNGVDVLSQLFAADSITPERYTAALAHTLGISVASYDFDLDDRSSYAISQRAVAGQIHAGTYRGVAVRIVCATDATPAVVAATLADARRSDGSVVLCSGRCLNAAAERAGSAVNLRRATSGLKRRLPLFSAGRPGPQWQPVTLAVLIGLIVGSGVSNPYGTLAVLTVLLTVPFLGGLLVRLAALGALFRSTDAPVTLQASDRDLPVYSVMIALYDEAQVLPNLIAALSRLDYPAAKLDCLLIIEDGDAATKAALLKIDVPAFVRVIVVPDGEPRTKPRALNYALTLARGDYVVIYDAEDRPEPDQLRRALAIFRSADRANLDLPPLACVQACLNIFNARQSWLTRGIMAQTPQAAHGDRAVSFPF